MDTLYLMVTITDRKLEKKFLKSIVHPENSIKSHEGILPRKLLSYR